MVTERGLVIGYHLTLLFFAFLNNVDNPKQQETSIALIKEHLENKQVILSEILLYEYAFVSKKLKEDTSDINDRLNFLINFIEPSPIIYKRTMEIIDSNNFHKNSFDAYHLAFAEYYSCDKLITFDKDYKKLEDIAKIEINIL